MTLLTAAIAAVIVTLVWYFKDGTNEMRIGTLSLMYWGATLMWLVDAVVEYIELKAAYFSPEPVSGLFQGPHPVLFLPVLFLHD